jgi:hypothetical protein
VSCFVRGFDSKPFNTLDGSAARAAKSSSNAAVEAVAASALRLHPFEDSPQRDVLETGHR